MTTWVKKGEGWNWLEKQLVGLLPEARVWTFGYDSSWCGDLSVDTDLNEVASKLLDAIVANVLSLIIFRLHQILKLIGAHRTYRAHVLSLSLTASVVSSW